MPNVTVLGAGGNIIKVPFTTSSNFALAQQVAASITAGVRSGALFPTQDTVGAVPSGKTGYFIATNPNTFAILPPGCDDVTDIAPNAVIIGSGDANELILGGTGGLTFYAPGGSGTIAAGGGSNNIFIQSNSSGNWVITTNSGNDSIIDQGVGFSSIDAGTGANVIQLGSGSYAVNSYGGDIIGAGSGSETIGLTGTTGDTISAGSSHLLFLGSNAASTVDGSLGSVTIFGDGGWFKGGAVGHNYINSGLGAATLIAAGDGDTLVGMGNAGHVFYAASGNETLDGSLSIGNDTFFAGTGNATITAGVVGRDVFGFIDSLAGGSDLIRNFVQGQDTVDLFGYGSNAVANALNSQVFNPTTQTATITLSDGTKITFTGQFRPLTSSDFHSG